MVKTVQSKTNTESWPFAPRALETGGGGVVSFDLRNGEERAVVRNQGQINPTSPEDPAPMGRTM
jgi:hypothetical protein